MITFRLLQLVLLATFAGGGTLASAEITLKNTINEPFRMWFRTEGGPWLRPPTFLSRNETHRFDLPGKHYFVVQDMAGHNSHIGWLDFAAIKAIRNDAELLLDQLMVTQIQKHQVQVTEYQAVTQMGPHGTPITVRVPVTKTVEQSYQVQVRTIQLMVRAGGKTQTLDEFLKAKSRGKPISINLKDAEKVLKDIEKPKKE
jgi:hypothetical protein